MSIPTIVGTPSAMTLRKDAPVYLYDTTKAMPIRIAARLKKEGFNDIYILKGGYSKWDGKKKTKKIVKLCVQKSKAGNAMALVLSVTG